MGMTELAAIAIVIFAGLVRGTTGFGGAMFMTPVLSVLYPPVNAVVIALILETAAALVMFPDAVPKARWRTLLYLTLPAIFTVPLGGYLLLTLDPGIARKIISGVVILFSSMLLFGFRYRGTPRVATSLALGSVVGALLGATSVGAPPVILYLLSGPDPIAVTRANLTLYVVFISIAGLVMLAGRGLLDMPGMLTAFLLAPMFFGGVIAGSWIFKRVSERRFRQVTLVLLLAVSVGIVVA